MAVAAVEDDAAEQVVEMESERVARQVTKD
jgi:hypothetical protein